MWYKLLMPNSPQHQSAVIKVVLSDRNGQNLFHTYLKNKTERSKSIFVFARYHASIPEIRWSF